MLNESQEIARGNWPWRNTMAEWWGAASSAMSIVIGAAVLGGILSALH